jgi:hypothetical protein
MSLCGQGELGGSLATATTAGRAADRSGLVPGVSIFDMIGALLSIAELVFES